MQAHGAHILQWAICFYGWWGDVCAPVHDAVLIECDTDAVDETMALAKAK